jgi:hypothetical protein
MPKKPVVEVEQVPKSGKWILKEQGEEAARASFDTKEDAEAAGEVLANAEGATLKLNSKKATTAPKKSTKSKN